MLARTGDHSNDPQLWFRPSKRLGEKALVSLLACGTITATPRLGIRDGTHAKGYTPGQKVTVRVLSEEGEVKFEREARITKVVPRRLNAITGDDLHHAQPYTTWQDVRDELSEFETRELSDEEEVTIVHFTF